MSHAAGTLIIGASHAGVQVAASLRDNGYHLPITLLEAGTHLPYQRPPLSKAYLKEALDNQRLALRGEAFYQQKDITLLLNHRALQIDRQHQSVSAWHDNREVTFHYDQLVIATGASARTLPAAAGMPGVRVLRDLDDAIALKADFDAAQSIVVIGSGFIGLEVASTAVSLGKQVTVVEHGSRILSRLFPAQLSAFMQQTHEQNGVAFCFDTTVERLTTQNRTQDPQNPDTHSYPQNTDTHKNNTNNRAHQTCLQLSNGQTLTADLVVVGIGATINDQLAQDAGLACQNGILVDPGGCTSDPAVYACGDCTITTRADGRTTHIESIQNALEQAKTIAANITGQPAPEPVAPWFWSDQKDIKLQMVGDAMDYDDLIVRGDIASGKFSLLYYQNERLIRVDSVNAAADHLAARKLVSQRFPLPKDAAADTAVRLKSFT
ncbi:MULTISPECIES: NAD(P)/FAD-dependent oxidoreductase [unclassified Oceanobacter]|uniref:NAD(P)/FAD-dependent oxidoreductase n=1 Tax=unclassified Oceanobacter TaxID=2620260 RepID=UPI002733D5E2|nr:MULTISPECIES: FAD-dependent oxidoreductase [unclassified Oceanobacter]MDP2504496.1 FAD-dependent oxidoreductase [Oceanobacter sp. 3_MG-2023]MDP2547050.1 FAD-dependent oxidoreductase [Oceanobacter sp. 4_MG-2023]